MTTDDGAAPVADGAAPLPGEGWELGPDGLPFREAARVILFDARGRVLLVRGHDPHEPERSWWFTVGGGIEAGESAAEAAIREVAEETGLALPAASLVGPVARRRSVFDFAARLVRQHEVFFVAYLEDAPAIGELHRRGWTAIEHEFMDEIAWWRAEELTQVAIEVFPVGLVDLLYWLADGWDGVERDLGYEGPSALRRG